MLVKRNQEEPVKKVRWGILGCANIAIHALIPAIAASDNGEVLAIASRGAERARETAASLNIPRAYGSYEELLADPDVEAVYIPLPNHMHQEWTIKAARAGKHVLCEKPLALDAADAREMVNACREAGVMLAEAFMYRYHPRYNRIKAIIASGEIGQVRAIHSSFRFNAPNREYGRYRLQRAMGGGALFDVGCYPVNAVRYLLGQEPEAVTCQAFFSPEHDMVDMFATGLLEFPGGVSAIFDCSMWADPRQVVEVIGSDGRIELPVAAFIHPKAEEAFLLVTVKGETRREPVPVVNQYTLQVEDFSRRIRHGEPPRFPADDPVKNMQVLEACLRSAREGTRILLS